MPFQDTPLGFAPGLCEHDILTFQHIHQFLSGVERHIGKRQKTQCKGGQDQVVDSLEYGHLVRGNAFRHAHAHGKPAQLHGKYHEEYDSDPEGWNRAHDETDLL